MDGATNASITFQFEHKTCRQQIPWSDNNYWTALSHPNDNHSLNQKNNLDMTKAILIPTPIIKTSESNQKHKTPTKAEISGYTITKKYFMEWRNYVKKLKEDKEDLHKHMQQKDKLLNFLDALKEQKQKLKDTQKLVRSKSKIKLSHNTNCYEHRFEAQQNIIEFQKLKLLQQKQIIEQLTLGKLDEEINRSIEKTEEELKEAFLKCSNRVKYAAKPVMQSVLKQAVISLYPISSKAPKIVQEMESRALEREQRRQIILERKRILEQKKKDLLQMEIENKKAQDEQARKESLRAIKERRRKELEHQQIIKMKKQEFFEKCMKADTFYKRKLKTLGFKAFSMLIIIKLNNIYRSEQFYETYLKKKAFNNWVQLINDIYDKKYCLADYFYNFKILGKIFRMWLSVYTLSVQNLQAAEDLYEMRLQSNTFIHWHRYTCIQYVLQSQNLQKACRHYNSRILLHYFYQWRSLPAVLKIEKAKEEKKQRWREKVWEILPDYNPVIED